MFKLNTIFCLFFLVAISAFFTSCNKNNNEPSNEPLAEYTLMLYGCGGGNLDVYMQQNLDEALLAKSNDKVKMTGQIKYSKEYQSDPNLDGTRRFILQDTDKDGKLSYTRFADASLPLYEPDNLSDFIRWSKQQCPAKNYILILWNHGGGWLPQTDSPKVRGILFDDNTDNLSMSLNELVQSIKKSDTHLKMIYYDACLMGMLENLCELTEVSDYALGAAHVTPGIGGDYSSLIENLSSALDMESAMKQYCTEVMSHWNPLGGNLDISLTNLSKLPAVTDALRKITPILIDSYTQWGEYYNSATCACYRLCDSSPSYFFDIMDYVDKLTAIASGYGIPTGAQLIKYSTELRRAKNDAIVCYEISKNLKAMQQEISWGVTLINKDAWDANYSNGCYELLAFDKATGWSKWLKTNMQLPIGNPGSEDDHDHDEENFF